jgi:hypothetical protein
MPVLPFSVVYVVTSDGADAFADMGAATNQHDEDDQQSLEAAERPCVIIR